MYHTHALERSTATKRISRKKCINMIILYLAISYLLEFMYKTISTSANIFQNFRHFWNEKITKFMKISFIRNTSIWLHSLRLDWCLRLAQKQLLWRCALNTDCSGFFIWKPQFVAFLSKIPCIGNFQSISITLSKMSCILYFVAFNIGNRICAHRKQNMCQSVVNIDCRMPIKWVSLWKCAPNSAFFSLFIAEFCLKLPVEKNWISSSKCFWLFSLQQLNS